MIFVTVGTHEQQFDRLIKKIDELKKEKKIRQKVFIQTGFSNYKPKYCEFKDFISHNEVDEKIKKASIIITHGGPSSFIPVLQNKKIPIVVPRSSQLLEHVNDHQIDFVRKLQAKKASIIPIYNVEDLEMIISEYNNIIKEMKKDSLNNNEKFCEDFKKIVDGLFN